MKTFVKIIALAFVVFNSACEPDDPITKTTPPSRNFKLVTFSANLAPDIVHHEDKTMFLRWSGKATSNLTDKVNLSLSHLTYETDGNEDLQIQGGSFNLWSDDYQHTLVGTYTGRGYMTNGQFVMEGNIQVQSGTGAFAYENASLTFSIGRFNPFSYPSAESEILIRGTLKIPVIDPVPAL